MKKYNYGLLFVLILISLSFVACKDKDSVLNLSNEEPAVSSTNQDVINNTSHDISDSSDENIPIKEFNTQPDIDPNIRGSRSENINNYGMFILHDDWHYVSDNKNNALYKMRQDGSEKTLVSKGYFIDINIVEDWLYYSAFDSGIWKMKLNGTQKTQLTDFRPWKVHVIDDYIFFQDYFELDLYRMKNDGTEKEMIIENLRMNTFYQGNYIFFTDRKEDHVIKKMDLYGHYEGEVYEHQRSIYNDFIVQENYLYLIEDGIWRIDLMTQEKVLLTEDQSRGFNIYDEWIFYANDSDIRDADGNTSSEYNDKFNSSFYKIKTDGSEKTKISNRWPWNINIIDDMWVYMEEKPKSYGVPSRASRIRWDGSDFQDLRHLDE